MAALTRKRGRGLCLRSLSGAFPSQANRLLSFKQLPTHIKLSGSRSIQHATTSQHQHHELTTRLAENLKLPLFRAYGSQLLLLDEPSQFYEVLKQKIRSAKTRIVLASLYIGKEETELIETIQSSLAANKRLHVTILVDALRSTRESSPSPSCASLIARLHRDFPEQVELRLYCTPKLKPWMNRVVGKRFNEGWGLQHMKIYGFDDDVLISGANLSRDYFTNRRDRYLLIEQHKEVCDYLFGLVHTVCRFSYRLEAYLSPVRGNEEVVSWETTWDGGARSISRDGTAQPQVYIEHQWSEEATTSLQDFTAAWKARTMSPESASSGDTFLLPLLQMGPLGIRQETKALPQLLSMALSVSANSFAPVLLNMTSGYFSLYKPYKSLLSRAQVSRSAITRIICAAPEANGFFQSKGVSGWIPEAYTWFEFQFWKTLKRQGRLLCQHGKEETQGGVELKEWKKDGWTYHAKGIWYTPPSSDSNITKDVVGPSMVHVGSSNYGSRSSDLDLECTFLISTSSTDLMQRLRREVLTLQKDATDLVDESLFTRPERHVRKRVKIAAWILNGML